MDSTKNELIGEFERQIGSLIQKGYPKVTGMSLDEFQKLFDPFKEILGKLNNIYIDLEKGHLPFVIVVKSELVNSETAMSLVSREGKQGMTKLYPYEPQDFSPIESVNIPESAVYLLVDIDRGKDTINTSPNEALKIIEKKNRSPLTIDEGIAIITQFPDFLKKNNCFSLLASRHKGDQRVPAIWINAKKHPNLGWCWDGNPHTWLGSASCERRI
jgi:hypothetical protein